MRNAFRIFRRDLKRILRNPAALLVIIGVSIIPSLYAWFNIVANIDPYANTSGIKVAVANNDQEASSNGLSINAGDEIITNLKENDQLGWTFVSEDEAVEGVRSGKYYAAIVIPDNFSESLLSVLSGKLNTPELEYYINEKANAIEFYLIQNGYVDMKRKVTDKYRQDVKNGTVAELPEELKPMTDGIPTMQGSSWTRRWAGAASARAPSCGKRPS